MSVLEAWEPVKEVATPGCGRSACSLTGRYRRTGADPPFGDPRRAHGVPFEGYYWRFTDAGAGRVVIVLCGLSRDAAGTWAIVALAAHPGGLVRSRLVPVAQADPQLYLLKRTSPDSWP